MVHLELITNSHSNVTPRKGATATSLPTLTPIATPQAASTGASSFEASVVSAATTAAAAVIGAATGGRAAAPVPRKGRMKFKDQGILANKSFFVHPDRLESYQDISSSFYMTGKINVVPWKDGVDYRFFWTWSKLLASFDERDLRTTVCKTDKTSFDMLKAARNAFDEKYPDHTPTKSKSKAPASLASLTPPDPRRVSQQSLTGVHMSPVLDPVDRSQPPPTDPDNAYEEDSASDDGSDVGQGDTYFPRTDTDDDDDNLPDANYDPQFMEMDGTYQNNM